MTEGFGKGCVFYWCSCLLLCLTLLRHRLAEQRQYRLQRGEQLLVGVLAMLLRQLQAMLHLLVLLQRWQRPAAAESGGQRLHPRVPDLVRSKVEPLEPRQRPSANGNGEGLHVDSIPV